MVLDRRRERRVARGERLVELLNGGSVRRGRDQPVLESAREPWPVGLLPSGSGLIVVRRGGV